MWQLDALGPADRPVVVKMQGDMYTKRNPIAVYDESRAFVAMISHKEPAFAALYALFAGQAVPKVYVLAWTGMQGGKRGVFPRRRPGRRAAVVILR